MSEYKKISKQLRKLLWLHISGGEPFLRDDLPEICELFYKNNRPAWISIPTNGSLPKKILFFTEEIIKRINIPLDIDIAIDGLYEDHDEIRGSKEGFDRSIQTCELLSKLREKYRNLSIKVITVITNKNIEKLERIIRFVKQEMKGIYFHSIIFMRGIPRDKELNLPDIRVLEKKKDILLNAWENYSDNDRFSWIEQQIVYSLRKYLLELNLRTLKEKRQVIPCFAGRAHAVIYADGGVSFCELQENIGNLRDFAYNVRKLWNCDVARKQREFIAEKRCFCTHECVQLTNILMNQGLYSFLFANIVNQLLRRYG